MKYLSVALLLVLASITFASPQYTVTLTNIVAKVVPDRKVENGATFQAYSNVVQGAYVENTAGQIYMALNSGSNGAAAPSNISGTTSNGTITYYRVEKAKRRGLIISNVSSTTLYYAVGYAGSGVLPGNQLNASGGTLTLDSEIQDAVYFGTNGIVSIQEL